MTEIQVFDAEKSSRSKLEDRLLEAKKLLKEKAKEIETHDLGSCGCWDCEVIRFIKDMV
jgi:hypothetical protein